MARFAFFCLSGSLAHAGRIVRLARALKSRGHDCVLVGKPGYFADPQLVNPGEFGVESIWEPEIDDVLSQAQGRPSKIAEHVLLDRMLRDESKALEKIRPDVVVADNRRSALISAELKRLPSLSLANATLLGPHCALEPTLGNLSAICGPALGGHPDQIRHSPIYAGMGPSDPVALPSMALGPAVEHVIRRAWARRREFVHQMCFGDRTLVLDPPQLVPTRDLPPTAKQPGPFFPELLVTPPPWWDSIDAAKPLVYLTYGSTGRAGFDAAVRQLATAGVQCAVTTAHLPAAMPLAGMFAARYLPSEIFKRARLVVCHGGTQTVYQSLAAGTPVVTLPGHYETALTSVALVQAQLGVTLPPAAVEADAKLLVKTVQSALADAALKKRVEKAAAGMNEAAALQAAVDDAESLLKKT